MNTEKKDQKIINQEEINYENPNFQLKASLSLKTTVNRDSFQNNNPSSNNKDISNETVKELEKNINLKKLNKELENLEEKLRKEPKNLPQDWEKYEDDKGAYYWHVPSGTIQREPPLTSINNLDKRSSIIYYEDEEEPIDENSQLLPTFQEVNKEQSFIVHSLGCTNFDETQLTAELSSKAIQRCIIELTTKGDNNAVRCWGKDYAKKLLLKVENSSIKLYDIPTNKILHVQPISSIRVWGVNANNDFAYVAKEEKLYDTNSNSNSNTPPLSPMEQVEDLKCHIFHCEEEIDSCENENEAQQIASLLKEEMLKFKSSEKNDDKMNNTKHGIEEYDTSPASSPSMEFPTPMEEPRKTVIANYMGKTVVDKPVGVDVLNKAIEIVANEGNDPIVSLVHISPSTIIVESTNTSQNILECRVRYLSFLGISRDNIKQSGFIVEGLEGKFEVHVFECRPNSSTLCKTLEEACKLRYQKCLDAHKQRFNNSINDKLDQKTNVIKKGSGAALKGKILNVFSKMLNK